MDTDVQPEELGLLFRDRLVTRRKELGISQQQLADRMNDLRKKKTDPKVHAPYISDLELGRRAPILGTLARLAEALETSPDWLVSPPQKIGA